MTCHLTLKLHLQFQLEMIESFQDLLYLNITLTECLLRMCIASGFIVLNNQLFFFSRCGPRMSKEACDKLKNRYVLMRNGATEHERETGKKTSIPITVR